MIDGRGSKRVMGLVAASVFTWGVASAPSGCSDEETCVAGEVCTDAEFSSCAYEGCEGFTCLAIAYQGETECRADGTAWCTAWPEEVDALCEDAGALDEQLACTEFLDSAVTEDANDPEACRDAARKHFGCLRAGSPSCSTTGLEAFCLAEPIECSD